MKNTEVNQYIHEKILGEYIGELNRTGDEGICLICREAIETHSRHPDYCSNNSPRSLLRAVLFLLASASAEQIARACVKAHQEAK